MSIVQSVDARTGETRASLGPETTTSEVDEICRTAASAHDELREKPRSWRAELLRALADELEAGEADIVRSADAETALGSPRLTGELIRTCYQLRFFADVVDEGSFLEAAIDHAGSSDVGPRPDLRRMLVSTGPVAVFGASNFPLAFSVPGGDTASAIAAGCSVVIKAHESHPATSQLCADLMAVAARSVDAPAGTLSLVHGREAGAHVVRHPAVTAVGFTGSLVGGRALMRIIDERLSPIPFYGELGSVNPLVVTPAAARERGEEIGRGFAQSFTLGMGQFCTKPGIAFVPIGQAGDGVVEAAAAQTEETLAGPLLNTHISKAFDEGVERLSAADSVRLRAVGVTGEPASRAAIPRLLEVDSDELTDQMLDEYFGPVALVVRYADEGGLLRSIGRLPASLTATIHRGSAEKVAASIRRALEAGAGRMIYDGYPTGVAVSWAQNHGGGWPASNSLHTSVGATAVRRFMRPLVWQDAPADVLPVELRDDMREIPRRVNGVMRSKDA